MKKSERTFAQRAIHSLQVSRNSLTEADVLKNSRTSTTWINQENHNNHLTSDMSSTLQTAWHVSWKVVIFYGKNQNEKSEKYYDQRRKWETWKAGYSSRRSLRNCLVSFTKNPFLHPMIWHFSLKIKGFRSGKYQGWNLWWAFLVFFLM